MKRRNLRALALWLHRVIGLSISVFLAFAGITGSLVAFYPQLDRLVNSELLEVRDRSSKTPALNPFEIRNRLISQLPPGTEVDSVVLHRSFDLPYNYWIDDQEVFVDPYSGKIRGSRHFGDLSEGRVNWMTFIYEFHFTLGLGEVGAWLLGLVALLWTVDCFVGAYLTLPVGRRKDEPFRPARWLKAWAPAWLLKTNRLFAFIFTWHRASGLWVWGLLFVFAWSGVALNLREEVYQPVMSTLFSPERDELEDVPIKEPSTRSPRIDLDQAHSLAVSAMARVAVEERFRVLSERYLNYDRERNIYAYTVESTRDLSARLAETTLYLDADKGSRVAFHAPTGAHRGHTITSWLIALHFGSLRIGGMPYRILVCALGPMIATLSVTGVWIWWRKRKRASTSSQSSC